MCGIIAIYLRNQQRDIDIIVNSYKMLYNRGPDSGVVVIKKNMLFGFRRLAIMDTSSMGEQPFNDGNVSVMCNGEIFNHKHLEHTYNLKCRSESDCECIIHLFNKIGFEKMIDTLSGDFALMVNSVSDNKVWFGRDRIGVRPLFYGFTKDGNFAVASYARALQDFCGTVNPVPPGWGYYDISSGEVVLFSYTLPKLRTLKDSVETEVKLKETLEKAVEARLMSNRPIGCLLSGGLDSSLITSILCKLIGPDKVRTYSIGMEGSKDLKCAKETADYLKTVHTEVLFTPEEGFKAIPDIIRDLESYDITTVRASVGMWLLAKYISKNTDDIVLYSGEGADELFCGYLYFHYAPTPTDLANESERLIRELYWYDVLRADRCISSHGLELRVPFLDRNMVDFSMSTSGELLKPKNGLEKTLLRNAFTNNYLPDSILFRQKDGFSDGVSGNTGKKWYEQIQDFVDQKISDEDFRINGSDFPSKEAYYYKRLFDVSFPNYKPKSEYWLPKWVDHGGDPSGRNLKVFQEKE